MRKSAFVAMSLLVVASMMVSGCRTKPKHDVGIDDPYGIGGEIPQERTDPGTLITDLNLAPVYLAYDSFLLGPDEISKVQAAASYLQSNPGVHCIIDGHCDERGTHEHNMALGQSRADAVRAALVGAGIGADRVESKSFGEEKPFSPDHDDAAWSLNRRGEFSMYQ